MVILEMESPADEEDSKDIDLDSALDALSSSRSRGLIKAIRDESPRSLDEVVEEIRRKEGSEPMRIKVALLQTHIPKLRDYEIIEQRGIDDSIHRGPNFEKIAEYLDAIEEAQEQLS